LADQASSRETYDRLLGEERSWRWIGHACWWLLVGILLGGGYMYRESPSRGAGIAFVAVLLAVWAVGFFARYMHREAHIRRCRWEGMSLSEQIQEGFR
jgi:hypothetical protein